MANSETEHERTERERLESLCRDLYPICRSITGQGFRKSLERLREEIPLDVESVPSGTEVFDWTVPEEWIIHDAYIEGPDERRYAEFGEHNLHLVNYSEPIDTTLSFENLRDHLYTLPDQPDAIPYVTTYYERNWGFCLKHETLESMPDGEYDVYIDSEFIDGTLTYGHTTLPGERDDEILLSTYLCHPTMANNELSGPLVMSMLYNRLSQWENRRFTYRFVVIPETIGSITYLHEHGDHLREHVLGGFVLTCLGGPEQSVSYKASRQDDALVDRTVRHLQQHGELNVELRSFTEILGSDERQYCSVGFDLPVGQLARTVYEQYPEYHTSKDDVSFMGFDPLIASTDALELILESLEYACEFMNQEPYGEPMLSKRDLYPTVNNYLGDESTADYLENHLDSVAGDEEAFFVKVLTILHYSDGDHAMVEIADICDCSVTELIPIVDLLQSNDLLEVAEEQS